MWLDVVIYTSVSTHRSGAAPQPMPELPGCMACERTEGEERGPFGWFSWEGNDLAGTFYFILSELKPHELWCSDPILSAGTRGSDMILEWSYDLRSTSARASHVLPQSFSVQKRSVS